MHLPCIELCMLPLLDQQLILQMLTVHRATRLSDHVRCISVLFIGGTAEFDNPMILGTHDPT
jgi:hypothetical protein